MKIKFNKRKFNTICDGLAIPKSVKTKNGFDFPRNIIESFIITEIKRNLLASINGMPHIVKLEIQTRDNNKS